MASGLYAALSGAVGQMKNIEVVSSNLSNISTAGYKKERVSFAAVLDAATQTGSAKGVNYTHIPNSRTDFSAGIMETTHNDYDVAINGDGFFKVRQGDNTFYTRLGNFTRALDGTLVTRSGAQVLSAESQPITIPEGPINIDESGSILGVDGEVGRLALFDPDVTQLRKHGSSQFIFTGDEGSVAKSSSFQLFQGSLERSNVKTMEETTIMMTSMRAFENYQKTMKNYFDLDAKANEIGSL